jgi:hypothetical protein
MYQIYPYFTEIRLVLFFGSLLFFLSSFLSFYTGDLSLQNLILFPRAVCMIASHIRLNFLAKKLLFFTLDPFHALLIILFDHYTTLM